MRLITIFLGLGAGILLSACASYPVYQSEFEYILPAQAGDCVAQCQSARMSCEENRIDEQKLTNRQCTQRSNTRYRVCLDTPGLAKDSCYLDFESCQTGWVNYDRCDSQYNHCYQACGGIVKEIKECVFGCDKGDATPLGDDS